MVGETTYEVNTSKDGVKLIINDSTGFFSVSFRTYPLYKGIMLVRDAYFKDSAGNETRNRNLVNYYFIKHSIDNMAIPGIVKASLGRNLEVLLIDAS